MKALRMTAPAEVLAMEVDRHHIISASAGTGKTFTIEHRVVDLIVRGAATVDEILVVTFTEKATAELRLRVRRKLESLLAANRSSAARGESGWVIDAVARRRLETAVLGFDRAPIFTIHGFCHRITAEHGFARGRSLHPVQVAAEAVFAEAFADLVRDELVTDESVAPLLEAWFKSGRSAAHLRRHLFSCRERGGRLEPTLDRDALGAALAEVTAALEGDPLAGLDVHPNSARAIERWLESVREPLAAAASASSAEAAIGFIEPVRVELRKLADKSETPDALPIFSAISRLEAAALDLDAAITAAILPRLEASLARDKQLRGQIDFGDMLGHVAAALEGDDGARLAAELRERYPLALIDEFQDTSELQWRIFRTIYLDAGDARLTVVGDPKQAIYGFRGADLHTYTAACEALRRAGAAELVLRTNYRSSPALVAALTRITATSPGQPFFVETEADAAVDAGRDLALRSADGDAVEPVVVCEVESDKRLRSDELSRRIVNAFADEVAFLLSERSGLELVEGSQPRGLRAGDIMMLTRSRADSGHLADALARRGVPSSTLHNQDLFTTREAHELLDLLRAIANPRSSLLRSRALATRFFDLPLGTVAVAGSDPDQIEAIALLHRWRARATRGALETLLPAIIAESKLALRELALDRGSRTVTNVEHLVELLVADTVRSRCSLGELAERLEARITLASDNESAEATPVRIEADADAVQIMTIHASKGLEAPVVFVFGGYGRRPLGSERLHTYHVDETRRLRVGRAPEALAEIIAAERDAEDERLMYVAITRAAARLYAALLDDSAFRVSGPYAILNRRLESSATGEEERLFLRRPLELDRRAGREHVEIVKAMAEPVAAGDPRELDEPELPADIESIRSERAGIAVTSYSRIKRSGSDDVAEKLGNDELGVDGSLGRLGGREVGILLHWILERIDLEPLRAVTELDELAADPKVAALVDRASRAFVLDRRYRGTVEELVLRGLTTPLTIGAGAAARSIGCFRDCRLEAREVEFTFPARQGERLRGFITGFLDVVLEVEDKVFVVDWKSDALASYDDDTLAAHVAGAYQTQLELYSLALERMLELLPARSDGERRFGGVIYCFLRGGRCFGVAPTPDDLERFRTNLMAREEAWQL